MKNKTINMTNAASKSITITVNVTIDRIYFIRNSISLFLLKVYSIISPYKTRVIIKKTVKGNE
jgi:hypothetical protein